MKGKNKDEIKNIIPNISEEQMSKLFALIQNASYNLAYEMTQEEVSYAIESLDRYSKQ